jgi:hypothetical protein
MTADGDPRRKDSALLSIGGSMPARGRSHLQPGKLSGVSPRAVGLSAAALFLLVGCSSAGGNSPGTSASTSSSAPAGTSLTPTQALLANARQSQNLTSATEKISVQVNGTVTTSGTIEFQRSPTVELSENLTVAAGGKTTNLKAIVTSKVFYLSEPALTAHFGKPWLKIDLAGLSKGPLASLAQIVSSVKSNDFVNQTQILAQAKNARTIGQQTVDGVPTTEYAGSERASAALKGLAPSLRKALGPALQALGNSTLSFRIWLDAQHQTRKVVEVETVNGETVTTTVDISGINQPVHITLPPASQTYTPPGA